MKNETFQGIDMPELNLTNFTSTDSTKIDINRYFQTLGNITEKIKDEDLRTAIYHRYITQRRERNSKFDKAYNQFFYMIFDNTFSCEVRKAFRVGEFYSTKEVKARLKHLYNHEFAPDDFYGKTPKMVDLIKNQWFDTKYIKLGGENGILIVDRLI